MKKVDGNIVGTYDGVIRIIHGNKGKTIYLSAMGYENDEFISLNDCLKKIGYEKGVCVVVLDDFQEGFVYIYGNYGNEWYEYGKTEGCA